jgi:hypothetical protein
MDTSSFPTLDQVRDAQPGELAVLLSTVQVDDVVSAGGPQAEALVAATQKVASWCRGRRAVRHARVRSGAHDASDRLDDLDPAPSGRRHTTVPGSRRDLAA